MISMEKIDSLWQEILPKNGTSIARRADVDHPIDFFIGYDENSNMQFLIVSETLPELPKSSQQIHVRGNLRGDDKYAICFSLTNTTLREIFIALCWDIMMCTYEAGNKRVGIIQAIRRFGMWQILLAKGSEEKLSDSVIRGLLCELAVLKDICIPKYGMTSAVTGWVGPLQADRDFEYEDSWIEVKAASLSRDTISISSFDQLDEDRHGWLVICRLEKSSEYSPEATTLNTIIAEIEEELVDREQALSKLRVNLKLIGYDINDGRSSESYIVHAFEKYSVGKGFPRIRRSELHPAISNGEYKLSIPAIQLWRSDVEVSNAKL